MANRLAEERSPYLLQHKNNPVDWWPWSAEAFAAAASADKPVFLSIGYSTCHWCHVMERESFEDHAVAALMNEAFINIKVDREERPDIDTVYMTACQLVNRHGGWPLSIIMTPDQQPFFAATYIPKHSRHGRMGMLDLVPHVAEVWRKRRKDVEADAERITHALRSTATADTRGDEPSEAVLHSAFEVLSANFDAVNGGFGSAPKFPSPTTLRFLMRYWRRTGRSEALRMVGQTLTAMRRGGIYDQIGWGFHRYATDETWTVPHFEKMLYDQAMLALTYVEAFQETREELFAQTAHEVLQYVLRDMTSPEGGFYSAEDADSEGREGKFYVWTQEELRSVLGVESAALLAHACNTQPEGNFKDEASQRRTGENILYLSGAKAAGAHLASVRDRLFAHRKLRVHPQKDDKILTDWNGLMIAALARATRVLGAPLYAKAAARAAAFIVNRCTRDRRFLLHRWRGGRAAISGLLDDYAYMTWGLLELYQTTFDVRHLEAALQYLTVCRQHFRSAEGAYFMTPKDGEKLLIRTRPHYDGPVPSGNAVMMTNLLQAARLTFDPALEREAWGIARAFGRLLGAAPSSAAAMLSALDSALGSASEVVIAGRTESSDTRALLSAVRSFSPRSIVVLRPVLPGGVVPRIAELVPALLPYTMLNNKATAYVCEDFACHAPATDVDTMLRLLGATGSKPNSFTTNPG